MGASEKRKIKICRSCGDHSWLYRFKITGTRPKDPRKTKKEDLRSMNLVAENQLKGWDIAQSVG
jgi:hypothetical protein